MGGLTPSVFCVPAALCVIGLTWLIIAYVIAAQGSAAYASARQLWPPLNATCAIQEAVRGVLYLEISQRDVCAELPAADGCLPLCVARLRCEADSDANSTAISSNVTRSVEYVLAFSLRALYADRAVQQPWCDVNGNISALTLLRNPDYAPRRNVSLATGYNCLWGDVDGCCPSCALFDTPAQLAVLEDRLRFGTFTDLIGAAIALICAGAVLIVAICCIAFPPCSWGDSMRGAAPERALDPMQNMPAREVEVFDSSDDDDNARIGRRARARPEVVVDDGRRRRRDRRRGKKKRPSAPPLDGSDDDIDDDHDTSPSPAAAAVVVRCKTCQMPFAANSDALACSSCHKISEERLERVAFAFAGGGDNQMCTVCLDEMEIGARVVTLPCAHLYHIECIGEWLRNKTVCPQCLTEIT
jgi:hypothetical protein